MTVFTKKCPQPEDLKEFMLGKLPRDESETFETHLSECEPCVETIRGLAVQDTLTDLAKKAWQPDQGSSTDSDPFVSRLIDQMREIGGPSTEARSNEQPGFAEDRSDVCRLLEPSDAPGTIGRIAHYQITELLGAGSTGVVFHAIDEQLQRPVALKILRPSLGTAARNRFLAEARATAALDHPNVIAIYHIGTNGPLAYIAMQWNAGETLEQKLQREQRLSVDQTKTLVSQIAAGLQAAHSNGLIHRDIKPANIWLDEATQHARILDFGLVRITEEDPMHSYTGMIAGTPCFMSPEQSRGGELDGRSDLFSLGCLMYQSLTGRLPFLANNALATLQSVQRDRPLAPIEVDPNLAEDLSDLAMCLLEKSPHQRPASAADVEHALHAHRNDWFFQAEAAVQTSNTMPPIKTNGQNGSRRWFYWASGVALALGAFLFWPHIIRIMTNQGEVVIESNDQDVQIEVLQGGERVKIIDLRTKQRIELVAGSYQIRPLGDDNSVAIDKKQLVLKRGQKEIVKVTRSNRKLPDGLPVERVSSADLRTAKLPAANSSFLKDPKKPYRLAAGDTLGIFIEGVLGKFESQPPIHYADPKLGILPSMGYPVVVRSKGTITLPMVPDIDVRGMTITEAETQIKKAFREGKEPILNAEGRIFVDLMRRRKRSVLPAYQVVAGDVLGVFVEGVLGNFESAPPINIPKNGAAPSLGYPIRVRANGMIHLPYIKPIKVIGKTIEQIERLVKEVYQSGGEKAILKPDGRIMVSLVQIRED